ncbi:MAG: serine hydrolase [Bacteroidota bacterium]
MKKTIASLVILLISLVSCSRQVTDQNPLEAALASKNPNIKRVMDSLNGYEIQIRYSQIDRGNDSIFFIDHDFQVATDTYFYPASTVKFPVAVLTLEKLNHVDTLDMDTRFYVEGDSLETTFAQEISKIFAVSDNQSYNRLFEFLGQDYINTQLEKKGLAPIRIAHRLSTTNADDITTKPLVVYLNDSTIALTENTINTSPKPLSLNGIFKGKGFYGEDLLLPEPFDFSLKNYYPIASQDGVLKRTLFPERFSEKERFDLSGTQRDFLLKAMHTLPKELGYDPEVYYDSYVKFFMYGDRQKEMPTNIKIYNKVGYAYGTLTDCAYITDTKNNIEFLLTATILVNNDGIFNDDAYEYDDIGIPFLAELGREIYTYELNRKK